MTTPLGLRLEQLRHEDEMGDSGPSMGHMAVPLRSFGTYAVWFPRGLMLNLAARHACKRLIDQWVANDTMQSSGEVQSAIQTAVHRYSAHAELTADALAKAIGTIAQAGAPGEVGASPGEVLSSMFAKLEDQLLLSTAQDDPGNWCKQAMSRFRDWMGAGSDDQDYSEWRKTKLARCLAVAAQKTAEHWDQLITKDVYDLMAFPGARVAGAEIAIESLHVHFKKVADAHARVCQQQAPKGGQAWHDVELALKECITGNGGFRLFGGRSKTRLLRNFLDKLSHYAHLRLAEELSGAARQCFNQLVGKIGDRLRDLGFCRQRLRHLQESLDHPARDDEDLQRHTSRSTASAPWAARRRPRPNRSGKTSASPKPHVSSSPAGRTTLSRRPCGFLQDLKSEQWLRLDRELHEKVLEPQGGLNGAPA